MILGHEVHPDTPHSLVYRSSDGHPSHSRRGFLPAFVLQSFPPVGRFPEQRCQSVERAGSREALRALSLRDRRRSSAAFSAFRPGRPISRCSIPRGTATARQSSQSSTRLPLSREALNNALNGVPSYETVEGLGDHSVRVLNMPVMESGRMVNLIQVGMSLKSMDETRFLFLAIMAGMLPLGLACSAYGGWLLARRALKPVDEMTAAARRISAEQLGERLNESGMGDELDSLAKTLNQMLTRLDAAFSQVKRFSADASHELQTPLTILKGEMELALRSTRTPEEYRETLESSSGGGGQDFSARGRASSPGPSRSRCIEDGPAAGGSC